MELAYGVRREYTTHAVIEREFLIMDGKANNGPEVDENNTKTINFGETDLQPGQTGLKTSTPNSEDLTQGDIPRQQNLERIKKAQEEIQSVKSSGIADRDDLLTHSFQTVTPNDTSVFEPAKPQAFNHPDRYANSGRTDEVSPLLTPEFIREGQAEAQEEIGKILHKAEVGVNLKEASAVKPPQPDLAPPDPKDLKAIEEAEKTGYFGRYKVNRERSTPEVMYVEDPKNRERFPD
jgi:hypothetical protein